MGVYYDAAIVHGLYIPGDEGVELALDTTDMWSWLDANLPAGFVFTDAGDYVVPDGVGYVVSTQHSSAIALDSSRYGFGVFEASEPVPLTIAEIEALRLFAKQHGLEPLIGWWGVSSRG